MPSEKGSYRSVYSAIWDDPEFQAFDPVTQAVFFCLRTSRDCNFPCIFPHYHSTLYERMPKAQKRGIDTGMDTLSRGGWIRYERPILWIVKGLKNEPNYTPNNRKHIEGIINILRSLPKLKIVEDFATYYSIPFQFDTPIHTGTDTGIHTGTDTPPIQGTGTGTGKGEGKGTGKTRACAFALPDSVLPETWNAFEEHRNRLRKPMTDRARHLIVRELKKIGGDPNALLDQSIRKGWQDVFPIKSDNAWEKDQHAQPKPIDCIGRPL